MTYEEFAKANELMMQQEHQLKMAHKARLNELEDEHTTNQFVENTRYKKAVREENELYHEQINKAQQKRREFRLEFYAVAHVWENETNESETI